MQRKRRLFLLLLIPLAGLGILFAPIFAKLDYLELPERASWQLPERVLEALDLAGGDVVADIGAGDGYFTFRLAEAVGPGGRVYAVDVEEDVVDRLRSDVEARGLGNVEVVLAVPDDPGLPEDAIDVAFVCNVYHHIDGRVAYFDRLRSNLAPGGRVVIVDVRGEAPFRWLSPPGHSTPFEELEEEMRSAGYSLLSRFDFLPVQDFVVFGSAR